MRGPGCSWSDKYPLLDASFLLFTHHYLLKPLQTHIRYYQPIRPLRNSPHLQPVILGIFKASNMTFYEVVWPPWTPEENMMLTYFCSRGFELRDVTRIMAYKLHRAVRTDRQCMTHMERLNQDQGRRGLQRLCENGMADWYRAAVDDYLIESTPDTHYLEDLLTFHRQYERLLRAVCPAMNFLAALLLKTTQWRENRVPLNEVLNVTHLRFGLQQLIDTHRSIHGRPLRFGGHYYR